MKILESTENRLVIGRETSTSLFELVCLSLWVNILVAICASCFVAIWQYWTSSQGQSFAPFVPAFAIGWLLVHLAFPGNKINASYFFIVILSSIPLAIPFLSLIALGLLQFPQIASLTFDKHKALLIIKKSKILFWYPVTQYPLDVIVEATQVTKSFYAGSMNIIPASVTQLVLKRRNRRIYCLDILLGADSNLVEEINRFLRHASR